ncbi:MAG: SDR family NAD(P)-dependent oxidoreductase [Bacteroidetes bacterium]|nr:SDR family NAD(P)-dependent oxidoreductase [Bacteroidota bacterium]
MDKKLAFITGATSGIGKATAKRFAREGWNVIINGRREERLTELKAELEEFGAEVLLLAFDVRDRQVVEKAVESLHGKWRDIDLLLNNAGLAAGLEHIDEGFTDDWERMIDTNLKGLLWLTRSVAPLMVDRNTGHIVNIGSIAGREVYDKGNVYCATKFAVDALTRGMRIDLLEHGIKVTNVSPGMVETEFSLVRFGGDGAKAATPYRGMKPLTGEDVADVIFYCATLPAHVNINDILVMPTAQASATHVFRT